MYFEKYCLLSFASLLLCNTPLLYTILTEVLVTPVQNQFSQSNGCEPTCQPVVAA